MALLQRFARTLGRGWMRFAHVLGVVNTFLLLVVVFVLVVIPIRLAWALIRKDPLLLRPQRTGSLWLARASDEATLDERRHPF